MTKNPRSYPETMRSAESGRLMMRGEKAVTITVAGEAFTYNQPGWWCSLTDPDDKEGQLVDDDNQVREMARRTAKAIAAGETVFVPIVIRAIRQQLGVSQREAGLLFQTGEKSFEKYESGEIQPSGPTKLLLRMAMAHPDWFRRPKAGEPDSLSVSTTDDVREVLRRNAMDRIYGPLFDRRVVAQTEPV